MPKVFLSYNSKDQPLVEKVALELRALLGEDQVFYDGWSIGPMDGIIDRMNQGLAGQDFFIWFLSRNSLASGPVELEWQAALFKAARERTKFCVVRLDDSEVPTILAHKVYIDMYNEGLENALKKILLVVQGKSTFAPKHEDFKNLTFSAERRSEGGFRVTVTASLLRELNPRVEILVQGDAKINLEGISAQTSRTQHGLDLSYLSCKEMGSNGEIYPVKPVTYVITRTTESPIRLIGVTFRNGNGETEFMRQST